jgi:hypothetical protein
VNLADYCAHAGQCAARADLASPDFRDAWLALEESFRFLAHIEQRNTREREPLNPASPALAIVAGA